MMATGMQTTMSPREIVPRERWVAARAVLLEREKEHTRMGDELARQRRELPWTALDKQYTLRTAEGRVPLAALFDGRSQLLIYHFMFGPYYEAGCPVNCGGADLLADDVQRKLRERVAVSGYAPGWGLEIGRRCHHSRVKVAIGSPA